MENQKLINRSFGFMFRGELLQGSAYLVENKLDIHFFFKNEEYPNSQDFITKNFITNDEQRMLNTTVNKFLSAK